jgi:hypothetical protein
MGLPVWVRFFACLFRRVLRFHAGGLGELLPWWRLGFPGEISPASAEAAGQGIAARETHLGDLRAWNENEQPDACFAVAHRPAMLCGWAEVAGIAGRSRDHCAPCWCRVLLAPPVLISAWEGSDGAGRWLVPPVAHRGQTPWLSTWPACRGGKEAVQDTITDSSCQETIHAFVSIPVCQSLSFETLVHARYKTKRQCAERATRDLEGKTTPTRPGCLDELYVKISPGNARIKIGK